MVTIAMHTLDNIFRVLISRHSHWEVPRPPNVKELKITNRTDWSGKSPAGIPAHKSKVEREPIKCNKIITPEDTVDFGRFLQMLNQVINSPPTPDSLGTYFFGIPNAVLS